MIENKKIVIVGPPGVGKTTIKKVFFEMANPYTLLNTSLEPTRGINSSLYSLFGMNLGVFDLAGQENEQWFKSDKMIFNNANLVLCVLDVNMYLKEILSFLNTITIVSKEIISKNYSIAILLHKIDLIDKLYLQHKIKALNDFLNDKKNIDILVYPTSITRDYFLNTYDSISEIIAKVVDQKGLFMKKSKLSNFRKDLEILLYYDIEQKYQVSTIFYDLNLSIKQANLHLERLAKLGFIEFLDDLKSFQLTQKADFFKVGMEKETGTNNEIRINRILESLFYFSNIKDIKDNI